MGPRVQSNNPSPPLTIYWMKSIMCKVKQLGPKNIWSYILFLAVGTGGMFTTWSSVSWIPGLFASGPFILNYKLFYLFKIHSFYYISRYVAIAMNLGKIRSTYNLECKKYVVLNMIVREEDVEKRGLVERKILKSLGLAHPTQSTISEKPV